MSQLKFDADMGRIQRALAQCHDMTVRRSVVLEALNLRTGERALEVGCGGGLYAHEAARCVGSSGRVCAVDISEDQIAAAKERCAEFPWAECAVGNVLSLPYEDSEFDAVYGVQVLEYVQHLDEALHELHRVLRPGGRVIILATNWGSVVWFSEHRKRMQRVLAGWEDHAPFPDLPAILPYRLKVVGFEPRRQVPVAVLNMSFNENAFSYWLSQMMRGFLVGREVLSPDEADAWLGEFAELESKGAYSFCSTPVMTEAVKLKL